MIMVTSWSLDENHRFLMSPPGVPPRSRPLARKAAQRRLEQVMMGLGEVARALGFVAASNLSSLEGTWSVARATVNGQPRAGAKMLNATWAFRGTELVVHNVPGERMRAALSFDATAGPPAFYVTPLDPPGDRPRWVIWARRGDELDLAFYDGVDRRPEDFGPRHKLVVLTLVPAHDAEPSAAPDPCKILRGAGVDRLLGGSTRERPAEQRASIPGSRCALDRRWFRHDLSHARRPAGRTGLCRRSPARGARQSPLANRGGAHARSRRVFGRRWRTVVVIADRRGTAMILKVEAPGVQRVELQRFAARVLDAL
jgi:uncharacterized protein (TIGR03067 family)